jgi:hypothetical protein
MALLSNSDRAKVLLKILGEVALLIVLNSLVFIVKSIKINNNDEGSSKICVPQLESFSLKFWQQLGRTFGYKGRAVQSLKTSKYKCN